jgi:hypothetical protein
MRDQDKTREQLIEELTNARQRIAELETLETRYKRAEEEAKRRAKNLRPVQLLYVDAVSIPRFTRTGRPRAMEDGLQQSAHGYVCLIAQVVLFPGGKRYGSARIPIPALRSP